MSLRSGPTLSPTWRRLAAALALAGFAAACEPATRGRDGAPAARDPDDGRATDGGEGVPGYLTDPEGVLIEQREGGIYVIRGRAGAVAAVDGAVGDVRISIVVGARDVVDSLTSTGSAGGRARVAAQVLRSVAPNADGSFAEQVAAQAAGSSVAVVVAPTRAAGDQIEVNFIGGARSQLVSRRSEDIPQGMFSLSGRWTDNCFAEFQDVKTTWSFDGGKFVRTLDLYAFGCGPSPEAVVEVEGTYREGDFVSGEPAGALALDLKTTVSRVKPTTDLGANDLNAAKACGRNDWAVGVAREVSGVTCTLGQHDHRIDAAGSSRYTVFYGFGGFLFLGLQAGDGDDGSSAERRHKALPIMALTPPLW